MKSNRLRFDDSTKVGEDQHAKLIGLKGIIICLDVLILLCGLGSSKGKSYSVPGFAPSPGRLRKALPVDHLEINPPD